MSDLKDVFSKNTHVENAAEVNINCVPGRLIIFFSNFMHSTPVQKNEGQKIVLSFNSIFENKK